MADPHRLDSRPASDPSRLADRDAAQAAQIEALLVEGLDRYFAHQYDDAIHVWTRVLFLDRAHARARAYIDRARTALAERQRHGEELLEASQDLLSRGALDAARAKLQEAVAQGVDDERVAVLWLKLERRERTRATASIGVDPAAARTPARAGGWAPTRVLAAALVLAGVAAVGLLAAIVARDWLSTSPATEAVAATTDHGAPLVLSSAEVAVVRARTLYAHGRLAEALHVLDRVPASAPNRAEADTLRREIQQLLLATVQPHARQPQGPTP